MVTAKMWCNGSQCIQTQANFILNTDLALNNFAVVPLYAGHDGANEEYQNHSVYKFIGMRINFNNNSPTTKMM